MHINDNQTWKRREGFGFEFGDVEELWREFGNEEIVVRKGRRFMFYRGRGGLEKREVRYLVGIGSICHASNQNQSKYFNNNWWWVGPRWSRDFVINLSGDCTWAVRFGVLPFSVLFYFFGGPSDFFRLLGWFFL